jgi:hypothetical protein
MKHSDRNKTTTTSMVTVITIVAALGLIGIVVITVVTIPTQQVAEARGCGLGSTGSNASQGRCFYP